MINTLTVPYVVKRAFQEVKPSRCENIIYDITKAMKCVKGPVTSNSNPNTLDKTPNITLFTKPKVYIQLEKTQHNLKVASIALLVSAAAIFILGFLSVFAVPFPISCCIFGTAIMTSATLLTAAFATGIAQLAKQAQYRNEVKKVAQYIHFEQPALENKLKAVI